VNVTPLKFKASGLRKSASIVLGKNGEFKLKRLCLYFEGTKEYSQNHSKQTVIKEEELYSSVMF
jgi:hypothetical protein